MQRQILAVDLGASGGRVMLGQYDGKHISIQELHRFSNDPVMLGDTMYWDFLRLFYEIKQGMEKAGAMGETHSIGIDTWGVDFGLIDGCGRLLGSPVHYRDRRTAGYLDQCFRQIDKNWFYQITGNQFMEINTAFQLLALKEQDLETLQRAEALLMMPDLFQYYLSGEKNSEWSIASTTQLFHMRNRTWAWQVIEKLGLPGKLFGTLVSSGTVNGSLRPSVCHELGIAPMKVISVAGHDTQCALAAVPTKEEDFIFISCGTWSLLGTELREPVMNERSEHYNVTNELGVEGRYSFLKNIIGLWLVQESRRQWKREGYEYGFGQLEEMASKALPLACFIDPDAPEFVMPGNIPERIRSFCRRTGQQVPETVGEIICCINQSLAMAYRKALEEIEECTGKGYDRIHMVGGGTRSRMLCQMTANACHRLVAAGPVEATGLGNAAIQYMASGEFDGLTQAREALIASAQPVIYEPEQTKAWEEAYGIFCQIVRQRSQEGNNG